MSSQCASRLRAQLRSRERREISVAVSNDFLCLLRLSDEADCAGHLAGRLANLACKPQLIADADRNLLLRREPVARHVDLVAAQRLDALGEFVRLAVVPNDVRGRPRGARDPLGVRSRC